MKQYFYFLAFCVLALTACTNSFKKGDAGLEYKIIADGKGKKVSYGNFLQLHFTQRYISGQKDTIIGDSRDYMPRINILDSVSTPPEYFKILKQLHNGDSLVIRTLVDSFYKRSPQDIPSFMKKGNYIQTSIKIINLFETKQQADSANKAELKLNRPKMFTNSLAQFEKEVIAKNKTQLEVDDKLITDYLAKNNIKATKTKWGTYIAVSAEGTGEIMNYSDVASVNYTGRTLDSGKVFDSNTDPKFKHTTPYQVNVGQLGDVILGWSDALLHLKKGSKATLFIPSTLAYGAGGKMPDIAPNTILVFDMEVVGVDNVDDVMARQEEQQKQMIEAQKRMTDSLQKAQQNNK